MSEWRRCVLLLALISLCGALANADSNMETSTMALFENSTLGTQTSKNATFRMQTVKTSDNSISGISTTDTSDNSTLGISTTDTSDNSTPGISTTETSDNSTLGISTTDTSDNSTLGISTTDTTDNSTPGISTTDTSDNSTLGISTTDTSDNSTLGISTTDTSDNSTPGISTTDTSDNSTLGISTTDKSDNSTPGISTTETSDNSTPGISTTETSDNSTPGISTTETSDNSTPGISTTETSDNSTPGISTTETSDNSTPGISTTETSDNSTPGNDTTDTSDNSTPGIHNSSLLHTLNSSHADVTAPPVVPIVTGYKLKQWWVVQYKVVMTNLSGESVGQIPDNIPEQTQYLILDHNSLNDSHMTSTSLQRFPHLNLAYNLLTTVPQLPNVISLNLNHNRLTVFDTSMLRNTSSLLHLSLNGNLIAALMHSLDSVEAIALKELGLKFNLLSPTLNLSYFENIPRLKNLMLQGNMFEEIHPSLNGHPHLNSLRLYGEGLNVIDLKVFKSLDLSTLVITHGNVSQIIPANLTSLRTLSLGNLSLTALDLQLMAIIPNLVEIYLAGNFIAEIIPPDEAITNVINFYLSGNGMTEVEFPLFDLCLQIRTMNFSKNKLISVIPSSVDWPYMTSLDLSDNRFMTFNFSDLRNMVGMEFLSLEANNLTNITPFDLIMPECGTVILSDNSLMVFNTTWFINMPGLKELILSDNKISSISLDTEALTAVERIILKGNYLTVLDLPMFSHMDKLQLLKVKDNDIVDIIPLKETMNDLLSLNLLHNSLTTFNMSWFGLMPNLTTLNVGNNKIDYIHPDSAAMHTLQYLYLDDNNLSTVNMSVFELMLHITKINLKNNKITLIDPPYCKERFLINGFSMLLAGNPVDHCDENVTWIGECEFGIDIGYVIPYCETAAAMQRTGVTVAFTTNVTNKSEITNTGTVDPITSNSEITSSGTVDQVKTSGTAMTDINSVTSEGIRSINTDSEVVVTSTTNSRVNSTINYDASGSTDSNMIESVTTNPASEYTTTNYQLEREESSSANVSTTTPTPYCHISPSQGVMLETEFTISCYGFAEGSSFLHKSTVLGQDRSFVLYSGGQPTVAGVTLPVGLASNGFYVALELTAAYSSGNLYEEIKTVQVVENNETTVQNLATITEILQNPNSSFNQKLQSGNYDCVYQQINAMLSYINPEHINDFAGKNGTSSSFKDLDLLLILEKVNSIPIEDTTSVQRKLWIGNVIADMEEHRTDRLMPLTVLMNEVSSCMTNTAHGDESNSIEELGFLAARIIRLTFIDWTDNNATVGELNYDQVKYIMTSSLDAFSTVITLVSATDPTHYSLELDNMLLDITRMEPQSNKSVTVQSKYGAVDYSVDGGQCTNAVTLFSEYTIHIWDSSVENLATGSVMAKMLPCHNSSQDNTLRKKRQADGTSGSSATVTMNITQPADMYLVNVSTSVDLYHNLNLSDPVSPSPVCVTIHPQYNQSVAVQLGFINDGGEEDVYLEYDVNSTNHSGETGDSNGVYYSEGGNRTLCVYSDVLLEYGARQVYMTVKRSDCIGQNECDGDTMYRYRLLEFKCYLWDDSNEKWTSDQCQVEAGSTPSTVKFKSNLFGSLAAGLFVGPNTIDFLTVFDNLDQKLLDNIAVVCTVMGVILLYVILAVICRKLDQRDIIKWSVLLLDDNFEEDSYGYEFHVYTGFKANAGTESNVFAVLCGTEGDSGIRKLSTCDRKNFQTGEVNSFLMTLPHSLGITFSLKIWHDNSGKGTKQSWFLDKIVVVDLSQGKWYLFSCHKWLSEAISCEETINISMPDKSNDWRLSSLLTTNLRHSLYNYYIWMSVAYRKTRSSFTRVQRLNCCLVVIFILILTNAMWYATSAIPQVAFKFGIIVVTVHQVYTSTMSSLIVLPVILAIILLYDKAESSTRSKFWTFERKMDKNEKTSLLDKLRLSRLPHWFIYVGHFLVCVAVMTSAFFSILYAFEWGKAKSLEWLGALVISLMHSMLLVAPLQVLGIALLYTFLFKAESSISEYESYLGSMQIWTYDLQKLYKDKFFPTSSHKKRKDTDSLHRQMMQIFYEVFWQMLLLVLVLYVVNGNSDKWVYYHSKDIRQAFLNETKHGNGIKLLAKTDTWTWLSDFVVPALHPTTQYNNQPLSDYDFKFMENLYSMKLGPPRIRQIRATKGFTCMHGADIECKLPYAMQDTEDTLDFFPGWQFNINQTTQLVSTDPQLQLPHDYTLFSDHYKYKDSVETGSDAFWGKIRRYSGGGYVVGLGGSAQDVVEQLNLLEKWAWIDDYTTALLLEINLWNANTNYFNQIIICVEYLPGGAIVFWNDIAAVHLYRYVGAKGLLNLLVESLTTIIFIVKTITEVRKICKKGKRYWKSLRNKLTLLILGLYNSAVVIYVCRSVFTASTVEQVMNNKDKYVSFQDLILLNRTFMSLLGLTAFLLQLQLLTLLRHISSISILCKALLSSGSQLLSIGIFFCVGSVAFTFFFYLMFGSTSLEYHSVLESANTLILGTLGHFRFPKLVEDTGKFGIIMFMLYNLLSLFIFINMLTTTLMQFLQAVSADTERRKRNHLVTYVINWFKKLLCMNMNHAVEPVRIQNTYETNEALELGVVNHSVGMENKSNTNEVMRLEERVETLEMIINSVFTHEQAQTEEVDNSVLPYYLVWNTYHQHSQLEQNDDDTLE